MPTERRSEAEIRREIGAEREQLTAALTELRTAVGGRRRLAAGAAGGLGAALTGLALVRLALRRRRRS